MLDTKVRTPIRPIYISNTTMTLLSVFKVGVRLRLEPTVLKAEVHSNTKAVREACGSSMLRIKTAVKAMNK